ncbi:MAG: hypothetical protein ACO1OF_11920 [Adhaeribacter sp.]
MNNLRFLLVVSFFSFFVSCKNPDKETVTPTPVSPPETIKPAVDPPVSNSIGFFLLDWQPKTFTAPAYQDAAAPATAVHTITIDASAVITKVPRSIAGDNANLWMTQILTEPALMTHLTNLQPHLIRFPGGSISDVFFWNTPKNTPPADAPAQLTNADGSKTNLPYWYGKNAENWTLSLDNYYQMLQQTNSQGIITVNYGYARYGTAANPVAAAAHLAADWVRYDNGRTKYWEIGNESFGDWEAGYRIDPSLNKDGQPEYVTGELYAQHFKIFADSMQQAARKLGKTIYIGAVLYDSPAQSWQTNTVKTWNTGLLPKAGNTPDFYIVHNYYTPFNQQTNADNILTSAPTETKRLMDFVKQSVQTAGVSEKPVALTEWNIFAVGLKQQASYINGMHGVMVLGEALKNKYGMTSRWDLANGWNNGDDHGLFNIGDEPDGVAKWNPRPAFYYLYFFKKFLGDRLIAATMANNPGIETYATTFTSGELGVTLVNKTNTIQTVELKINNLRVGNRFYWYTLTGGTDNGEFSRKIMVNGSGPAGVAGGPANYATLKANSALTQNGIKVTLPARSVVNVAVDKK